MFNAIKKEKKRKKKKHTHTHIHVHTGRQTDRQNRKGKESGASLYINVQK